MRLQKQTLMSRLTALLLRAAVVLAAVAPVAAAENAGPTGDFALRGTLGGGSVTQNGFDNSLMAGAGAALSVAPFVDVAGGFRYYPEFSSGGGQSKGTIEVLMLHAGAELGWRLGRVKPFVRPELNLWQARPEYQGRDLEDDDGVSPALFAGVNVQLVPRFGLILEGGRSFDVSGTHVDTLSLGAEIRF